MAIFVSIVQGIKWVYALNILKCKSTRGNLSCSLFKYLRTGQRYTTRMDKKLRTWSGPTTKELLSSSFANAQEVRKIVFHPSHVVNSQEIRSRAEDLGTWVAELFPNVN
jgi:hypothetical protein